MARLDDMNYVKCECGSDKFEPVVQEEQVWEMIPIKQNDGTIVHKSVSVNDLTIYLCCSFCGKEISKNPEPSACVKDLSTKPIEKS